MESAVSFNMKIKSIFILLLFIISSSAYAGEGKTKNIGWITDISGKAKVIRGRKVFKAETGAMIYIKDEIMTGADSSLKVQFDDDSVLTLGSGTRLMVTKWLYNKTKKENKSRFKIFRGRVRGLLKNLFAKGSSMRFETPTSLAGVKGSDISVWVDEEETRAAVTEGHGFMQELDSETEGVELSEGKMATVVRGKGLSSVTDITEEFRESIKQLNIERRDEFMRQLRSKRDELNALRDQKKDSLQDSLKEHQRNFPKPGGEPIEPDVDL